MTSPATPAMPPAPEPPTPGPPRTEPAAIFAPHASREMAAMFDEVSPRYDLLNRLMTLGRDSAWRAYLAREVPEDARVVLDLCTGSGPSLRGLRRPGRLVIGADVSLAMLRRAREQEGWLGWAPRLVAADAFKLPLRDASVDAVTVAFGVRNLRPHADALAEIARVLRPAGTLAVLEGTAPAPGPLAPLHRFHLRRVLPWLGKLSPDPSAYGYLGQSILEFGAGPEFERTLASAGFEVRGRRRFLLGAARLWAADLVAPPRPSAGFEAMQLARVGALRGGTMPTIIGRRDREWRTWTGIQLAVSIGILVVLVLALRSFADVAASVAPSAWSRRSMGLVLGLGIVGFTIRSLVLASRLFGPPPRG